MVNEKNWHCWEIMQCKGTDDCPARLNPEIPCWEIARELDDYRSNFNVCKDCLVYLTKNGGAALIELDIQTIMEKKGLCALSESCPQYLAGGQSKS